MTGLTRRNALMGASAAVAVVSVPTVIQAEDAELIALGRQWIDAYGEWIGTENANSILLKRVGAIEDRMAEIPVHSPNGALVKLRIAAENLRLMNDIDDGVYSTLTYQAWQALETETFDFEQRQRELGL